MRAAPSELTLRSYLADPATDARIRALISTRYTLLGRQQDWTLAHFDSLRWGHFFEQDSSGDSSWMEDFCLWQQPPGELAAVLHPGDGEPEGLVLEVHPAWQQAEPQMLAWAEQRWQARGLRYLSTEVYDWDTRRAALLEQHGWLRQEPCGTEYIHRLGQDLPRPTLPNGYHIRAMRDDDADIAEHIAIIEAVFKRVFSPELLRYTERRPTPHEYWVVEAPNRAWAAWCGLWRDEQNSVAEFEPVGTHPDHRRKGLARAVMLHAMHAAYSQGMRRVVVNTGYGMDANQLYAQVLGSSSAVIWRWTKQLTGAKNVSEALHEELAARVGLDQSGDLAAARP